MTEPLDSDHPELLPEADWAEVVAAAEALNDEVTITVDDDDDSLPVDTERDDDDDSQQ